MHDQCSICVDQYIQRYGWLLLDREAFIERVQSRYCTSENAPNTMLRACVLAVYSVTLYHACSGSEGQARQNQGYGELTAFLDRAASHRYRVVCADATQRALEQIFRCFNKCRQAETFLAFTLQKLRDAARAELRLLQREEASLSLNAGAHDEREPDTADTVELVLQNELRRILVASVQRCLEQYPRAAAQLSALWLSYIDGLDDQTIAKRLGKTSAAVQVLRSRGLARLRHDAGWQQLGAELGLAQA